MSITVYIPARISSERLERKLLKQFNGRTLIEVLLEKISDCKEVEAWYLNTESHEIASMVNNYQASVYMRPIELATSSTTTEEILKDFVTGANIQTEYVAAINPTSPLLSPSTIDSFFREIISRDLDTAFSVTEIKKHCFRKGIPVNFSPFGPHPRTQDVETLHILNWSIVAWRTRLVHKNIQKKGDSIYQGMVGFITTPESESIDIDTIKEFEIASQLEQIARGYTNAV